MWFDRLHQDARYALRSFARNPLFTVTAVLSLAIGIGANTTIFSIANGLLLRPAAGITEPDRLVDISGTEPEDSFGINQISFPNYVDLRDRNRTMEDLCGYEPFAEPMSLGRADGADRIFGHRVTTNYFAVLGVGAAAGRLFDGRLGQESAAEQTVVLSYRFWTRRFNGDPAIVGQTVSINGSDLTVVGVAASDFEGTSLIATDAWVPFSTNYATTSYLAQRGLGWALIRGRLNPSISVAQASAEIETIARTLEQEYPNDNRGKGMRLTSASLIPGNLTVALAGIMTLIMGFVSLVLVIACSNLAGVLLARATARRREVAVRVAIGADRARLVQQLLTETMLLFLLGGAAGLLLASGLTSVIISLLPAVLPVPLELSLALDGRTIVFTAGLSFVAALLCGLAPALQASKPDVVATLKDEASGVSNSSRVRNGLVVAQVALSIVLVIGAGVFVRALQKSTSIEPGFEPSGVELASLDLSLANYTAVSGQLFLRELTTRVREIPTVQDASAAASLPTGGPSRYGFLSHPEAQSSRGERLPADWNVVQPRYFSTMRIPLVAGRDFSDADREGTQRVMIVNEEAARRYWPGQNPIGKVLMQNLAEVRRNQDNSPKAVEVIGVVGNVTARLRESARPQVYLPLQQQFVPNIMIAARTVDGQRVAGPIRQVVTSMNGTLPILSVQTLEEAVAFALLPQRLGATVSGSLGIVGLLLATMGIYGVTAFAVAQRTREIGIRVALGATRSAVVTMVLRFGMSLVAIGTVCGLLLAWMLNTVLTSALSGFPPMDALPFLGSAVLFVLVGLTACLTPMRRATRIDPLVVLRDE